ncbi:MAG: hypothetical protein KUG81_06880, partial [Gammaproteobacteria bacterium]|nr:hypothetical protein [Gammaproteobacteria bacterium]
MGGHIRGSFPVIRTDYGESGLDISSSRLRTNENSQWLSENSVVDYRGVLQKRPEMALIAHQIVEPTDVDLTTDMVSIVLQQNDKDWETTEYTPNNAQVRIAKGGLIVAYGSACNISTTGSHTLTRMLKNDDVYDTGSSIMDFTYGMTIRARSLFPNAIVADTDPGIYVSFACRENRYVRVGITELGMYVQATTGGAWKLIAGSTINDNAAHEVQFQFNHETSYYDLDVYIDGVLVGGETYALSLGTSNGEYANVQVVCDNTQAADELCAVDISGIIIRDQIPGIEPAVIESTFTRYKYDEASDEDVVLFYAATQRGLWVDEGNSGIWRYAGDLTYPETSVVDFRDSTIILNSGKQRDTILTQIFNDGTSKVLDDAPNIRFAKSHNNRVWGSGDTKYPLRVYFSGDRAPNQWFAPETDADGQETLDEVLRAGYFEIDSHAGDYVSALWGDYYGNVIVGTRDNKLFRIAGNSLATWQVERLDDSTGALGPVSYTHLTLPT